MEYFAILETVAIYMTEWRKSFACFKVTVMKLKIVSKNLFIIKIH